MMREIPTLQTLCLREIGGKACSPEITFAPKEDGTLSSASKLLRSFHQNHTQQQQQQQQQQLGESKPFIAISRIPLIGPGSARRPQANDVDLNHPWIAVLTSDGQQQQQEDQFLDANTTFNAQDSQPSQKGASSSSSSSSSLVLCAEHNTPALDLLQCYIDSLVELSRMDDNRLGLRFFQEWTANVLLSKQRDNTETSTSGTPTSTVTEELTSSRPTKKARKSNSSNNHNNNNNTPSVQDTATPLGSLSLHNTIIQQNTIQAMVDSQMTNYLAVLDCTGIQTLTDSMLQAIITKAPQLQRLSVKNCRRLTGETLECLATHNPHLVALDVGGAYNLQPHQVIELTAALPRLMELHVSGLAWTDSLLFDLLGLRCYKALSLGFLVPHLVTAQGLKQALETQSSSLQSLALPFCEHLMDATMLGGLGRHLPHVQALDVRGNSQLATVTGWYDGRATIQPMVPPPQPLFVLARYSGITKSSIDDTKRIHPLQAMQLNCCLGSDGTGMGIQRTQVN